MGGIALSYLVERAPHQPVPVLEVAEAVVVRDVVGEQHGLGPVNVVVDHLSADGLAADVPDLEGDVDVPREHEPLDEEVEPNGLLVHAGEVVLREPRGDRGLADGTITEDDHLWARFKTT
jgi:hypothetical protein